MTLYVILVFAAILTGKNPSNNRSFLAIPQGFSVEVCGTIRVEAGKRVGTQAVKKCGCLSVASSAL